MRWRPDPRLVLVAVVVLLSEWSLRRGGSWLSIRRPRRPSCVATPWRLFSLAATSPSALGRPPTPGRFRLGPFRALPRRHPASA
jgi:hypothetical protein